MYNHELPLETSDWRLTRFSASSQCVYCGDTMAPGEEHYVLTHDRKAPLFKRRIHRGCLLSARERR